MDSHKKLVIKYPRNFSHSTILSISSCANLLSHVNFRPVAWFFEKGFGEYQKTHLANDGNENLKVHVRSAYDTGTYTCEVTGINGIEHHTVSIAFKVTSPGLEIVEPSVYIPMGKSKTLV